jgi:hypothetical protein
LAKAGGSAITTPKRRPSAHHAFQRLHRLAALRRHALGDAVQRRGLLRRRQRMLAAVEQRHLRRAAHRAADAEAAGVAEGIEHRRPRRQPRDARAMLALVEEPAGLLPAEQVHGKAHAVLLDHRAGGLAVQQPHLLGQAFERGQTNRLRL